MIELDENYMKTFGKNLKRLIDFGEKTQRDIAKEVGCSQKSISNWINGVSEPRLGQILRLKKYFECDYYDLIEK